MFAMLTWFSSLVAAVLFLVFLWNRPPREDYGRAVFYPTLGTLGILALGWGVFAWVYWLDGQGMRPNPLLHLLLWNLALLGVGGTLAVLAWRSPAIRRWPLWACLGLAIVAAYGSLIGMDRERSAVLGERLERVREELRALEPKAPPVGEDARVFHEEAERLLESSKSWGNILNSPLLAVRKRPELVRTYLDEMARVLELARKARACPAYSPGEEDLMSLMMGGGSSSTDAILFVMGGWIKLLRLQAVHLAAQGDAAGAVDAIECMGDLVRQSARDPGLMRHLHAYGCLIYRATGLEGVLAALGPEARFSGPTFPVLSDAELRAWLLRVLEYERRVQEGFLLDFLVGGPEPPGCLRLVNSRAQDSFARLLSLPWFALGGEGVRLYRLFAMPMDLRAVDNRVAEALRRARDPHAGCLPMPDREEERALGVGFLGGLLAGGVVGLPRHLMETQTSERLAVAALAVYRYRAERGKYPKTLTELVPRYLSAVPEDAGLGLPLSYEWAKDGAAIYSQWVPRRPREREPAGDGVPPWKSLRKAQQPQLVFLLGAFLEEELAEDTADFEEEAEEYEEAWEDERGDEDDSGGTGRP